MIRSRPRLLRRLRNSANRYEYKFGITVNTRGERFCDEGETKHSYTYAKTGRAVLAQPGGIAHQIYDDVGFKLFREGAYGSAKGFNFIPLSNSSRHAL